MSHNAPRRAPLVGLLLFILASSPPAGTVDGIVTGDDAAPLEGAGVQLFDESSGRERHAAATRSDGSFTLGNVRAGPYRLVVTYLGYATHTERLTIEAEAAVHVEVELSSLEIENDEVIVVARRARRGLTPITHSDLTARDLELQPAMKNLPVHLATLPSVTYHSENGNDMGYTYLRMRGFDQRRVAVSINGMPQNDPEEHNVYWINFFDLQGSIEDIQVQRGAGSAFYGSTGIGGAVNIVATPYRAAPYATAEVGYGAYDTQRFTLEANSGFFGDRYVAYGRISRLSSDGYRDWSWSKFQRFFVGLARYGTRHTVTLQAYGGPQRDALAYVGIPKEANESAITDEYGTVTTRRSNFSATTRDEERFHQPHFELLHDWQVRPGLDIHQSVFWLRGDGYFDFGGTYRSADYLRLPGGWRGLGAAARQLPLYESAPDVELLFRAALDLDQAGWMPRVTIDHHGGETTVGGEARLHRSLSWGRIQESTLIPSGLVGSDSDVRVYNFRGEKIVTSLYGSHFRHLHPRLAMQADVQLSWRRYRVYDEDFVHTEFSVPFLFVNPRFGVTFNPQRPLSGYASLSFANREPRMSSLYEGEEAGAGAEPLFNLTPAGAYDWASPLVKPERLWDLEVGAQLERPRFRVAANAFWMNFRDEIVPSGGLDQFGVPRTGNAGHTRHVGLEFEATARPASGLDVYANATLSRNRFVRFLEFVTLPDFSTGKADRAGNPIAGFPDRIANLGVTYTLGTLTARMTAMFSGVQFVDNAGGRDADDAARSDLEVDPYTLVNASLHWDIPKRLGLDGLRVSVDVNNVLNDRILLFGNEGWGAPQFFPAATRHLFFTARYQIR